MGNKQHKEKHKNPSLDFSYSQNADQVQNANKSSRSREFSSDMSGLGLDERDNKTNLNSAGNENICMSNSAIS